MVSACRAFSVFVSWLVIPAEAGIQRRAFQFVIPAEAGIHLDPPQSKQSKWIPAFAGMTTLID
jgi:hypothetical protein